jgi:hypothetical protein
MNRNTFAKFSRKIKFGMNIPFKVFKKPKFSDAVTSDLFPIRNDENWSTEFELLNLPGLIKGDITKNQQAVFIFFNGKGLKIGEEIIEISGVGRKTINIKDLLSGDRKDAKTFAVFHKQDSSAVDIGESFMAERGYTGYKFKNITTKGYVHGNLDAISYSKNSIEKLGNFGFQRKIYRVQHLLTGPAEYDFIFTNPTNCKKIKIQPILKSNGKKIKFKPISIESLGCDTFTVKIQPNEIAQISFRSRLYLGRPVVFRKLPNSMDVFHG